MKKVSALLLSSLLLLSLCGCGGGGRSDEIVYPDLPLTPAEGNSWDYLDTEETYTIRWFMNYQGALDMNTTVGKAIKEKLGINIRFTYDDGTGQKLNLVMNGKQKYDIVSVQAWQPQAALLAGQNYIYPIDGLAERWAPGLSDKIGEDLRVYYEMADGLMYGLPSSSYSEEDMEEGQKWPTNGGMLVRKDWAEEWFASKGYTTDEEKSAITTKEGLIEAMAWVKKNKPAVIGGQTLSPMLIDAFTLEGNNSVLWLSQYFAAPYETEDGHWQDVRTTPQYKEALAYLNRCRREGYISDFYTKTGPIDQIIKAGAAFVTLGTPQLYGQSYEDAYKDNGVEYVPLLLRGDAGDDPVLQDLTGYGYMYNMIMRDCTRPDIVVKVFDFLWSEEGQMLTRFGIEGKHWNWNEDHTAVEWTQEYLNGKKADEGYEYSEGINRYTMFERPAVVEPYLPDNGYFAEEAYADNLKRPLAAFAYRFSAGRPALDTRAENYKSVINKYSAVEGAWQTRLLTMLEQSSESAFENYYKNVMNMLDKAGIADVTASFDASFQRTKEAAGADFIYPTLRAGYETPTLADGSPVPWCGDAAWRRNYEILDRN